MSVENIAILLTGGVFLVGLSSLLIISLSLGFVWTNSKFSSLNKRMDNLDKRLDNLESGQDELKKLIEKIPTDSGGGRA